MKKYLLILSLILISCSDNTNNPVQSSTPTLYIGEVGTVCNGFNENAVYPSRATEAYMSMYNICGERVTAQKGDARNPALEADVYNWMRYTLNLNEALVTTVATDIANYGSALHFYDAADGYRRYLYVEPYGDGLGLLKYTPNSP